MTNHTVTLSRGELLTAALGLSAAAVASYNDGRRFTASDQYTLAARLLCVGGYDRMAGDKLRLARHAREEAALLRAEAELGMEI